MIRKCSSQSGLLYSADGGKSWEQLTSAEKPVTMVETTAGGQMFAFVIGEGLLRTSETDMIWQTVSNGPRGSVILHFAVAPAARKRIQWAERRLKRAAPIRIGAQSPRATLGRLKVFSDQG